MTSSFSKPHDGQVITLSSTSGISAPLLTVGGYPTVVIALDISSGLVLFGSYLTSAIPEQINKRGGKSLADGILETFVTAAGNQRCRRLAESGRPGLTYVKTSLGRLDIVPVIHLQLARLSC